MFIILIIIFISLLIDNIWKYGFGFNGQSGRTNFILITTIGIIIGLFVKKFKK